MLKRYLRAMSAVGALLAVTAVVALADEAEPTATPAEGVEQITTVEPAAEAAMEALEQVRTAADALPADVAEHYDQRAPFGANPGLSRRLIANTTNSVYVVPADDRLCVALTIGQGAGMTCPLTSEVADGLAGPATASLDGDIAIFGLVPDGVESIDVNTGETDTTQVETTDNAYYTVLPQGAVLRSVSYTGPSGEVEFEIHDPSLAFEE
jgi:hypothetical protein